MRIIFKDANDITDNQKKSLESTIAIILKAQEICEIPEIVYEFECPTCRNTAKAAKAELNGHIHGACETCKVTFVQ